MKGRVYVLIFFVWAMLTIITPTLVLLSSSSSNPEDLTDGVYYYNQEYIKIKRSPIASSRRRIEGIMIVESDPSINETVTGIGFWDFVSSCFKEFQGRTSELRLSKRKDSLKDIVGD